MNNSEESSDVESFSSSVDNLKLTNSPVVEVPNDIVFPNELNKYLRDQVQYLMHENGMLKKNLSENELWRKHSEAKIETLSSQVKEYQSACSGGYSNASALASAKIVDLSKKLREKTSEVEVLKTKCSKLEQLILQTENTKNEQEKVPEKTIVPPNELEEQIKTLQEKLSTTSTKLFEAKNQNVQLKNDLKLANKLLQQEVGENFDTLQAIANSNSNWRGRAQIICDLQQKNNELRDKVRNYQNKLCSETPVSQVRIETKNDALVKENDDLKNNLEAAKKKLHSLSVRLKYYESECCALKAKLEAVNEQNERDHDLITNLTAKLSHNNDTQNELAKQKQLTIDKLEQENKRLKLELEKEKCRSMNLQKEIDNKLSEVDVLKKKSYDRPLSKPTQKNNVDESEKNRLEVEKQRLLELVEVCNKRLEAERSTHLNTHNKYLMERQRAAKLEANLARLQLQTNRSGAAYSNMSTRSKASENDIEDQLELAKENIKTLQTRLQIEQQERRLDFQEFSKILQNSNNI